MKIILFLALVSTILSYAAIADDVIVSKKDSLSMVVSKMNFGNSGSAYALTVTVKINDKVITSKQTCETQAQCEQIKSSLQKTHSALKSDERLALQFQSTEVVGKVVRGAGATALSETILPNFPADGVIEIGPEGLMTRQDYKSPKTTIGCRLDSVEPVLIKNSNILIISGAMVKKLNSSRDECITPISHSHVTSIICRDLNHYDLDCASLDLNSLNQIFKGRLSFYFPASKVAIKEPASTGVDDEADLKKVDKPYRERTAPKNRGQGERHS